MKKGLKITLLILIMIVILGLIAFGIDYTRTKKGEKPIFCIKLEEINDGGTTEYFGLGYKVIDFHTLAGFDDVKIGTWAMQYEDFEKEMKEYEDILLGNNNMAETMKVVVVKANENNLLVMKINDESLISIGKTRENIGYQKGQILLVHFNGMIMETYPAQLGNVGKIEILNEKLDVTIPDSILRYCYSTKDKVNITISKLTNTSISMVITDTNELPYIYAHSYNINKRVKNKDYGKGQKIGEDTENSVAGFTRDRTKIYMGKGRKDFKHFK